MNKREAFEVTIDGEPEILIYNYSSMAIGYQYNTAGNKSAHCFNGRLMENTHFHTNGHSYHIIKKL